MRKLMDTVVVEAAGGDVRTVLTLKTCLLAATHFLACGFRVGFHKIGPEDYVVTGMVSFSSVSMRDRSRPLP